MHLSKTLGIRVLCALLVGPAISSRADVVEPGNLIVQGNLCVGFDCINNQDFGNSTIMLRENNTRLRLEDPGIPSTLAPGWNLEANSTINGGPNYFRFELKPIDPGGLAPVLTFAPAGERDVTLGRESEPVTGQVSVGKADLHRRLRHLAQGMAESDALVKRSLDEYSPLEQRRALIEALADQVAALEAQVSALEQADLDGDGVSNIDDQCPNTPAGETSDSRGCSVSQRDSDGDGASDDQDMFPNAVTQASVGGLVLNTTPSTASSSCSIQSAEALASDQLPPAPLRTRPVDVALAFTLTSCSVGETIAIEVDLGIEIPDGYRVYKVGETWREIRGATIAGSIVRYTVTDGGPYDADGEANGVIVDPVTAALPGEAVAIPLVPAWLLAGMTALVGGLGLARLRRSRQRFET